MIPELLVAPGNWYREGRGLTTAVEGLTAQSVELAIDALPTQWAPYRLLAASKMKQGKHYVDIVQEADVSQLDTRRDADGQWDYFLWSPSITPGLARLLAPEYVDSRAADVLSLNGLVNIQYRPQSRRREEPTRVGCVHKVRSDEGELILHAEYERVYRALLRSLRKSAP